ncbi:hypothetical protein [Phytohabitans aurantiacus]|uniref:Prenyltransferase n=1 Tax=Phytohabitans aurantiacus TaxID=3016789 RepID=A0ABQ5RAF5_9ACTN|nr:hypothetical protein [Phytohabitans aurantiacus]GLI03736.1 hypothetical protein Pa4123_90160 [Phytohabitans aurantiacus]
MNRLNPDMSRRAAAFVWLTGRVLDQRRLAHFTGGNGVDEVLRALDAYETSDGGHAFALEPDIRGPLPQPLTSMTALRVLDEVGALDAGRAARICTWLAGHVTPDGGIPAVLGTILAYPRPPWIVPPEPLAGGLLPTGRIAGLLLKHGVGAPWLDGAVEFCWSAVEGLTTSHPYEVESAVAFLDHAPDRSRAAKAAARLGDLVRDESLVLVDPSRPETARPAPGYAETEFHYAYDFAPTPSSLAAAWFTGTEWAAALDHLAAAQQDDGGWPILWRQWSPTTAFEARPAVTVEALRTLRAHS